MSSSNKGLSSVIGGIILIAITVAVSIAIAAWMGGLTFTFMKTEQLLITGSRWSDDTAYIDLTIKNVGTDSTTISTVQINDEPATSFTVVSGSPTINPGDMRVVRISSNFAPGVKYQFTATTSRGTKVFHLSVAPHGSVIFKMEWGTAIANQTFTTVNLHSTYSSPVIVCTPQYDSDVPRTVRLVNVTSQRFSVKVQNPSATSVPDTVVHYVVVEEGVWASPLKLEARRYSTGTVGQNSNWAYDTRDYGQTYSGNLIILHQVMSYDDPAWATTYVSKFDNRQNPPNAGDSGFRIALNGAEAVDSHGNETIGYIVLEEGLGTIGGIDFEVTETSDFVRGFGNSPPYNTAFSQSFDTPPAVLVAAQLEMDGGDGSWVANNVVTQASAGLMVDEDQVRDSERSHTTETCGFIAFQTAGLYP
ncbi:MAG: hypothetical protein AM326_06325 [Candidatus Thorarchaeota archaeon SMTZ-45]|nr:MAG: hypothetical protein AM326_06325 [Candidatus Thorarchaeota archaeon SMTZ-45]